MHYFRLYVLIKGAETTLKEPPLNFLCMTLKSKRQIFQFMGCNYSVWLDYWKVVKCNIVKHQAFTLAPLNSANQAPMLGKTEMRRWQPDFMMRESLWSKKLHCASFSAWFHIYSSARRVKESTRVQKLLMARLNTVLINRKWKGIVA